MIHDALLTPRLLGRRRGTTVYFGGCGFMLLVAFAYIIAFEMVIAWDAVVLTMAGAVWLGWWIWVSPITALVRWHQQRRTSAATGEGDRYGDAT